MSSGTYTEPFNYATNFNVPLLMHIVVCSSGLNQMKNEFKIRTKSLPPKYILGERANGSGWD